MPSGCPAQAVPPTSPGGSPSPWTPGSPSPDGHKVLQISTKSTRYMLQKSRGVFFLRSPKRRRQTPPIAQLGGALKPVKMQIISRHFVFSPKMSTFQNLKIEMLEYAWEQFPHIQNIRCGEKSTIVIFRIFSYKLPINHRVACMLDLGVILLKDTQQTTLLCHCGVGSRYVLPQRPGRE